MPRKRLLLLGGGHAHVQVVRAYAASRPQDTDVVLLSESRLTAYSGMLPGLVAGHYRHDEAHIDLAALCEAAGVGFIEQRASALDLDRARIETTTGERHAYDIASIDTGSMSPIDRIPGAARHGVPVKPVEGFLRAIARLDEDANAGRLRAIAVVGAGAAGIEVALAIDHRLRRRAATHRRPALHLYADAPHILPEFPERVRRCALQALQRQSVDVRSGRRVVEVTADGLRLDDGRLEKADAVYFVTGAAPSPIYREAGLATDGRGFVQVHPSLQSVSHPAIFACGDVAAVVEHPRPKAGVFAVRQGPPLADNLRRALAGEPLRAFAPQREYLVLLSTGGKHAIATRNGWTMQGGWVWHWKDRIDRRFVRGFTPAVVAAARR